MRLLNKIAGANAMGRRLRTISIRASLPVLPGMAQPGHCASLPISPEQTNQHNKQHRNTNA